MAKAQFRNSGLQPNVEVMGMKVSAVAFLPLVLNLFHWDKKLLIATLAFAAFFIFISKLGYTPFVAIKKIRSFVAGNQRNTEDVKVRRRRMNSV